MMDIEDVINDKSDIFKGIDLKKLDNYIYEIIKINPKNFKEFDDAGIVARRKFKICPKKSQIIHYYRKLVESNVLENDPQLEKLMIKKLVRGSSGVEVITVLTSPYPSWTKDGKKTTQKFSCGKNCGYCPKEPQVKLKCEIISKDKGNNFTNFTLKTNDDLSEIRVVTYLMYQNKEVPTFKQNNFNKDDGTFDVTIHNKYCQHIEVSSNCIAIKIEQPRSYISTEPAVMRANRNNFDPILQFYNRASGLEMCGQIIDKIELIVLGGTWSHYPVGYQEEFIRDLYYAANTYYSDIKRNKLTLDNEIIYNQSAKCRIIGLTLETRPDCINKREIFKLRRYGCTRVQLGVQHIDDNILHGIDRGCYHKDTVNALQLLKHNCFKVDIHLMPDLPGSNFETDKKMFDSILGVKDMKNGNNYKDYSLTSPEIQADQWKIYPTEVTRWTKIFDMFQEGIYKPYAEDINPETNNKKIVDLLIHTKQKVFPWIRLNRVIRDIPDDEIFGGNSVISLRQDLHIKMANEGKKCNCIRCREVRGRKINLDDIKLLVRRYNGIDSDEYFISFESNDEAIIYGFCRLRLNHNNKNIFFETLNNSALVRELHVYGIMVPHDTSNKKTQHRGLGKKLLRKAEQIAYSEGYNKVSIISGIGVREYYQNRGYHLKETFMVKNINYSVMDYNYFYNSVYTAFIATMLYFVFIYYISIA